MMLRIAAGLPRRHVLDSRHAELVQRKQMALT
jgi:hypothetical protein